MFFCIVYQPSAEHLYKQKIGTFFVQTKNRNDFWYMLKLYKSYIFVQGKIKNGTKTQTKNRTDFLYIQKIGSIYFDKQNFIPSFCINKNSDRFYVYTKIRTDNLITDSI